MNKSNTRTIKAHTGTELQAKSWLTEAPLRMLMNNLDPAVAERPEEAIHTAEVVLLLLADAAAIRDVLLGETARKLLPGRTIVQMGTIGPRESCALRDEISDAGGE